MVRTGSAKTVKELYVGVGNAPRKVKEGYIGVSNTAKQFYEDTPAYPGAFKRAVTYMHDADKTVTYTAPQKGWYKIHVVGDGGGAGNLGRMIMDKGASFESGMFGGGASSGSTGAYAIHDALMEKGDTITITLNAAQC